MGAESRHHDIRSLIKNLPSRVGLKPPGKDVVLPHTGKEGKEPKMTFKTAVKIFDAVIRTDEISLKKIPDCIGGYTAEEDLQATQIIVALLQEKYGKKPNMIGPARAGGSKSTLGNNRLLLYISPDDIASFALMDYRGYQLSYKFPLRQFGFNDDTPGMVGFYDNRGSREKIVRFMHSQEPDLEKFKAHFRGKRWADLNMLRVLQDPNAEVIMPKDLDTFSRPKVLARFPLGKRKAINS